MPALGVALLISAMRAGAGASRKAAAKGWTSRVAPRRSSIVTTPGSVDKALTRALVEPTISSRNDMVAGP
jgi:hypothetical protein